MSSYLKIHVISDLFLGFNEKAEFEHTIPAVDLVIINGNIGLLKRSMLYAETLCKKYPNVKFIYNFGELEAYYNRDDKEPNLFSKQMHLRKNEGNFWPKNLYWDDEPFILDFEDGRRLDVLCVYGFPNIVKYDGEWEHTHWYKNYNILDQIEDIDIKNTVIKPKNTSYVKHGTSRNMVRATPEYINQCHLMEKEKVQKFELRKTATKLLITHINPYKDNRYFNLYTRPYEIHLLDGYWIASNQSSIDTQFLGATLISNPGRGKNAREKIYNLNLT